MCHLVFALTYRLLESLRSYAVNGKVNADMLREVIGDAMALTSPRRGVPESVKIIEDVVERVTTMSGKGNVAEMRTIIRQEM